MFLRKYSMCCKELIATKLEKWKGQTTKASDETFKAL